MVNAVQYRMVEEALVEKDVYDAMMSMRTKIDGLVGFSAYGLSSGGGSTDGGVAGTAGAGADQYPELPVGKPQPGMRRGRQGRVTPSRARASMQEIQEAAQSSSDGGSRMPVDAGVPTAVLASGDPLRDPARQVKPYVPPTHGGGGGDDPFPQLGAKGKPLG